MPEQAVCIMNPVEISEKLALICLESSDMAYKRYKPYVFMHRILVDFNLAIAKVDCQILIPRQNFQLYSSY